MKKYSPGNFEKAKPDDLENEENLIIAKVTGNNFLELTIDQNLAKQERCIWLKRRKEEIRQFMFANDIFFTTHSLSALRSFPIGSPEKSLLNKGVVIFCTSIYLILLVKAA